MPVYYRRQAATPYHFVYFHGARFSDKSSYCLFVSSRTIGFENTLMFASHTTRVPRHPLASFKTPHPRGVFLPESKHNYNASTNLPSNYSASLHDPFPWRGPFKRMGSRSICTMNNALVCSCQVLGAQVSEPSHQSRAGFWTRSIC